MPPNAIALLRGVCSLVGKMLHPTHFLVSLLLLCSY